LIADYPSNDGMNKKQSLQTLRIGTSGWVYPHWQGIFYPDDYPKNKWLEYYALHFDALELNASFYHLPNPVTFEKWKRRTPAGFVWAVKLNRYVTHVRRLKNVETAMHRFYEAVALLGNKLGPILIQLPPSLVYEKSLIDNFLDILHPSLKHAIEIRHASWMQDEFMDCLRQRNVAFCISDTAGRYPMRIEMTADFAYLRLHGSQQLYASLYTEEELKSWAEKIRAWSCETWVFFDNDSEGNAVRNALRLKEIYRE
jgi:uncharacterized protein YecE (DUF72 family)